MYPDGRKHAPATARNREPILEVLRRHLPETGIVLEIASGTGEHAVYFGAAFAGLTWQPSDPDPDSRRSIAAWSAAAKSDNVRPPLDLDVQRKPWPVTEAAALLCVNMIHISPWAATEAVISGAAGILPAGAPLIFYGPFRQGGIHTADSNAVFDESLRDRNPAWGVRDIEAVEALAASRGFGRRELVAMPANNLMVVFGKQ